MNTANALLFDLDGTLTDSGPSIINSYRYAFEQMGLDVPSDDDLRSFVGPPLRENFLRFLEKEQVEEAVKHYRYRLVDMQMALKESAVYDGIVEMLEAVKQKGVDLYICTAKPEVQAKWVLNHFGLEPYFTAIYGTDLAGEVNTKGKVINKALLKHDIIKTEAIMIGDRHHDIDGGKEHGLRTIGVGWGYGSEKELREAGADAYAKTPKDLLKLVL